MAYDYCIIGGGIVGLATARAILEKRPGASLVLLEKEKTLAKHQTGHNSGVIHSGIYYSPGSLKARLCRDGAHETKAFCREHDIYYHDCGKLIVATDSVEKDRMENLYQRSAENGVAVEKVGENELRDMEPYVSGIAALRVPGTAIVDYREVCNALAKNIISLGGEIKLEAEVLAIRECSSYVEVDAESDMISTRRLVVCPGLQADRLARLAGLNPDFRIVPFRGEYYRLSPRWTGKINHLIYPVPDPALPFLGIHLTNMVDGSTTVGPNAMLGMAREGYRKFSLNARDMSEYLLFSGFWKMMRKNFSSGVSEFCNSMAKSHYLKQCRKYCPDLSYDDLKPIEAGIRAQAVSRDGSLIHDFLFLDTERSVFVCNAPSPAATSALPIGKAIARRLFEREGESCKEKVAV
ncbi:L-2-hydroxyglutarate oxidase [Halomonas smyrnensis]|uniref:L-2-hydroxyglutarate oxidase n=1 Tax=Halomonas smyrnensis TaxID=720605 RepID=UPI000A0379DD|nr:L-2-hydroxyglutarate oxidase [Halomonas smyrnensis]